MTIKVDEIFGRSSKVDDLSKRTSKLKLGQIFDDFNLKLYTIYKILLTPYIINDYSPVELQK